MTDYERHIYDAWVACGDNVYEIVGRFRPVILRPNQDHFTVPEPLPCLDFHDKRMPETVRTHTFPIVKLAGSDGRPFFGLLAKHGDPVYWLRDWTWAGHPRRVSY